MPDVFFPILYSGVGVVEIGSVRSSSSHNVSLFFHMSGINLSRLLKLSDSDLIEDAAISLAQSKTKPKILILVIIDGS